MVQGVAVEDGHLVDVDPATGKEVGRVKISTAAEVEAVIQAATSAQVAWADKSIEERGELLKQGCSKIQEQRAELETLIVQEMGKVLSEAKEEVDGVVGKEEWIDHVVAANQPESLDGGKSNVFRQPHGVVAVLGPWNFPADEILLLAIPALIAGNAVVVKPSEVAPLTGALVIQALKAVLPSGVLDVVQGEGAVGAQLVGHLHVSMAAMTGSSDVGKKIMGACSQSLKRIILELGGKDPMVVFADSDIDKAARDAVFFSVMNCGQVCSSVERVYVDESVKAQFEKKVAKEAAEWKVGNGMDASSKVGPCVSKMQRDIVARHVAEAVKDGANMLFQSSVPEGECFHPVTVLTDLRQDMAIMREETFGPVVGIAGFDGSEEKAVQLSNDSPYGLSACVYSKDMEKAKRVSRKIKAGQVGINNWPMLNADAKCPWVGHKGSGFGYHSGPDGWRQFSLPQSIVTIDEEAAQQSGKAMLAPLMNNSADLRFDQRTFGDPKNPCIISIVGTGASMNNMMPIIEGLADQGLFVINFNPRDVCGSAASKQCEALVPEGTDMMRELGKIFTAEGGMDLDAPFYAPYNWVDMADDVAVVMDRNKVAKASIIGFSTAGAIAQVVLWRLKDRLTSAILGGTGYDLMPSEHPAENKILAEAMALAATLTAGSTKEERVEKLLPSSMALFEVSDGDPREAILRRAIENDFDEGWIDTFGGMNPYSTLAWASYARCQEEHKAKLKENQVPCLVIHGRSDPVIPFAQGEKLAANTGSATFEAHDHGHILGPASSSAALLAKIAGFVKSKAVPAAEGKFIQGLSGLQAAQGYPTGAAA